MVHHLGIEEEVPRALENLLGRHHDGFLRHPYSAFASSSVGLLFVMFYDENVSEKADAVCTKEALMCELPQSRL